MALVRFGNSDTRICKCGVPVAILTSWTTDNPGRRFIACKFYDRETKVRYGCDIWEWVDINQEEWQRVLINKLILEKKVMSNDIEMLKREVVKCDKRGMKLAKENEKLKKKVKSVWGMNIANDFFCGILGFMVCLAIWFIVSKI